MCIWYQQHQLLALRALLVYIDHVFCYHGLSKTIVSDRDPRFTAAFFRELFALLGTKLQMSSANHPQTDGQTERMNRVVEETLRAFVNHQQTNWDELLPVCQFAINNSCLASTGESPFFLNSGYDPLTPASFLGPTSRRGDGDEVDSPHHWLKQRELSLKCAKDCLIAAQARQAFYSDKGRKTLNLNVGDNVMVHREFLLTPEARNRPCDKLRPRWYGPFRVLEKISPNAIRLELPHELKCHPVFNVRALKKHYSSTEFDGRYVSNHLRQ